MEILDSQIDVSSPAFAANRQHHQALVDDLRARLAATRLGGTEVARTRHTERGALLARDRVEALLDPGARAASGSPG